MNYAQLGKACARKASAGVALGLGEEVMHLFMTAFLDIAASSIME
jgi:hypothetical protein